MKALLGIASAAALLASTPAAAAVSLTFDATGAPESYDVIYDGFTGDPSGTLSGLSALITFTFDSTSNGGQSWTFDYTVNNTSSSPVNESRISIFGFDVSALLDKSPFSDAASATGEFGAGIGDGNMANATNDVDICFRAGGGGTQCTGGGGANDGVTMLSGPASGSFTLNFTSAVTEVTFSNLLIRYQSLDTDQSRATSATGQAVGIVPEPGTWALMILGFGAVGATIRRRRAALAV